MSRLTRDDVLKLARLSRLRLSNEEVERFQNELSEILDYVEALNKIDTSGLEPTSQVTGLVNVMRDDQPLSYQATPDDLLANAPALKDRQFKVKRVLD